MRRLVACGVLLGATLVPLAPAEANHSAPATYAGRAVLGGTVSLRIAASGKITRIVLKQVETGCGTISSTTTGKIPIVKHAFSYAGAGLKLRGSFPARNKARGTLSYRMTFPSCTGPAVKWTAKRR
jgi:hypothetical protein